MPHLKYHIEESLKLFGEPFEELHLWLNEFKAKRVTGAFIVSLIKQLSSTKKMNGSVDADKLNDIFQLTHSGHYSSNAENFNKAVGFM